VGGFFEMLWGKLLDLGGAIRDLFANLFQDFRDSNRFFKIKIGLIAGYVAVGLATLMVFVPPGELNEIDAFVREARMEVIGGRYFLVINRGDKIWKDLRLTLNDSYRVTSPILRPGRRQSFYYQDFKGPQGEVPGQDIALRKLRIDCSAGAFERDYTRQ
jgi:hypothetical protein